MAAVTSVNILGTSANASSATSSAFTPAANDLLLVAVYASGSVAASPTLSSSVGGHTFSLVGSSALKATSADGLYLFVANQLTTATSQTVTFDTSDAMTGTVMNLYRVSGMTLTGTTAIRQSGKQENQASSSTPAVTLGSACQSANPVIAATYNASTAPTAPSSWTAGATTSHTSPTQRGAAYYRDSGETGSTITWGGTSSSEHCSIVAELETATLVALTGQGVTVSRGLARALPKLSSFTDAFGSLDTTTNWTNSSSANGTASVVSGQLDLTTNGASGQHATIESQSSFDFRGDEIYVQMVRPCLGTSAVDGLRTIMRIYDTAGGKHGDYVEWYIDSAGTGNLGYRTCDNGGILDNASVGSWSSTNHKWLKISLNENGTSATWWTAPDSGSGTPGTWTSQRVYSSLPSTFSSVKVALWLENWSASPGAVTQTGRFDGLNGPLTGDTSVNLTGQAVTVSRGTMAPATDAALTGQAVTAARDTLVPATAVALTGQAATAAKGTLAESSDSNPALTGQAATVSAGTLTPSVSVALTGQAATVSADTLTPVITYEAALTGQATTVSRGLLGVTADIALTGQSATSAQGTTVPATNAALTGQAATVSRGALTETSDSSPTLTGQAVTASRGSMTAVGTSTDAPEQVYSGGALGFWLDATPIARFETTSTSGTALSAYNTTGLSAGGQFFGKWVDRSGNSYHALEATDANRPFAVNLDTFRYFGRVWDDLTIANAGGSTTGFYFAAAIGLENYYGTIYSDQSTSTATNGFRIFHSADGDDVNPMIVFAANGNGGTTGTQGVINAGNAANQVRLSLTPAGHTLYGTPAYTNAFVIECWYDGTRLYGRLNGGAIVQSTNTVTVSAGGTTAYLNSNVGTDVGGNNTDFYEVVQAKNSVPSQLTMDAVRAYLTDRITSGGARGLVGQAATVTRGSMTIETARTLTGQAVTAARDVMVPATTIALTGQGVTVSRDALVPGISTVPTGQAVTASKGVLASKPKVETLTDSFSGGSVDTTKWTSSNTNGTVSIVSDTLDLTTTGASGAHATISTVDIFDLNESAVYVQVVRPYLGTVDTDGGRVVLRVFDSATGKHGDYVEWFIATNSDLAARVCDNGTPVTTFTVGDWNSTSHKWLKISKTGDTVTWWTAPDSGSGTPGTWTSQYTYSALPSTFVGVQVALWVENWGTAHGAITQSARLDGFNTATTASGTSVSLTGQAATVSRGTLVPTVDAALAGQAITAARDSLAVTSAVTLTGQAATPARGSFALSTDVALTGQAVTVSKGSVEGNPITLLTDDFSSASLDTTKWTASSTNGTVSIVSNTLDLTTTGVAGAHATVTSVNAYSLAGTEAYVKLVRPGLGTSNVDGLRTILRLFDSATGKHGDYVEWFVDSSGSLGCRTCDNGTIVNNVVLGAWSSTTHAWLKISLSGATATWWTAPDSSGFPGTWTSRNTYSTLPSTFTNVKAALWLENWSASPGAVTQTARFDGFNTSVVSGTSAALTGQAVTVGRGSPTITSSSSPTLTGQAATVSRGTLVPAGNAFSAALTGKSVTVALGPVTAFNNYVLLTSFGAVGDGVTNNLTAFQNAFANSVSTGRTILVTEGVFAFSGDVLRMTGAKMEGLNHNCVIHALNYLTASIFIRGTGTVLRNVKLTTAGTYTRTAPYERTKVAILGATNFTVDRVRIEHSPAASIQTGEAANNGVISNCSIFDSEADSIHISDRCSFIEIHHNEIYNSGDDGVAVVSYMQNSSVCHHITAHHNKVINNDWGRNMSVVGGEDCHYYQNYLEGNAAGFAGIIAVSEDNVDFQTRAVLRCRFENNTLKNCGSSTVHAAFMPINEGAVRINDDLDFVRNHVIDTRGSPAPAFRLFGPQTNVLLDRNKIDNGSAEDYQGVAGDPDITLILYDSGTFGQTEPVGPTSIVDVTLAGKAVTVGRGTLSASTTIDVTLAGKLLTASRGILDPANTLTGKLLTASRGTVIPETSINLTGYAVTAQHTPMTPGFDLSAPLGGQAVTSSGGALAASTSIALTGQAITVSRDTLTPGTGTSLMEMLTDHFTGTSIDTTKWTVFTNGSNSSVTQDGELIVDIDGDVALPASYVPYPTTGVNSTGTFKIQGSYAYVRVTPPVTTVDDWGMVQTIFGVINAGTSPNTPNDEGFGFVLTSHPTKKLRFKVWNDLGDEWEVNAATEINYDATNHKWLRLRESGGTLYWDTAPDSGNGPGTWTQRASYSTALLTNFQSTSAFFNTSRVTLRALHYADAMLDSYITSAPRFDGLNTNRTGPTLVALTGQTATVSRGTLVPNVGGILTGQAATVSQGTVSAAAGAIALTGQAATVSAGTLAPSAAVTLTGQAATTARGVVDPTYSGDLIGQAVTAAKGTLGTSAPGDVTPNNHAVAVSTSTMAVDTQVELVGQGMTAEQHAFIAEITRPLTGYGLVMSQGLFSLTSAQVTLTGHGVTVRHQSPAIALDSDIVTPWTQVTSTQSPAWTPPSTAQTPAWDEPETDQTPRWSS